MGFTVLCHSVICILLQHTPLIAHLQITLFCCVVGYIYAVDSRDGHFCLRELLCRDRDRFTGIEVPAVIRSSTACVPTWVKVIVPSASKTANASGAAESAVSVVSCSAVVSPYALSPVRPLTSNALRPLSGSLPLPTATVVSRRFTYALPAAFRVVVFLSSPAIIPFFGALPANSAATAHWLS